MSNDEQSYPGGTPSSPTPDRRRGSMRRTTTHDCCRPEGMSGPVVVTALGRDLLTHADGRTEILELARVEATVEYSKGLITKLSAHPPHAGLDRLRSAGAYSGFRSAIDTALPGESASHSVRFQLLDELPTATLQSGRALRAAGIRIARDGRNKPPIDLCAGWAEGGSLLRGYTEYGPPLMTGPQALPLVRADDALSWHALNSLPPHSTRRLRRLDLWEANKCAQVECFFRDSHVDADEIETIVHEWTLHAEFNARTRCFISAAARIGPLPYVECPGSAPSAGRLAGMAVEGLRRAIRSTFVGPSTCAHLNDTMRSMEDVGALWDALCQHTSES